MKKIIVINGSGTSGKDEIIKIVRSITKDDGELIIGNVSSIDSIREKALLFGWDGEKDDKGRKLLFDLKDAWIRYNDGPFIFIKKYINNFLHTEKNFIIFVHIREALEIKKIVDYYDKVVTLLVRRDNIQSFNNHADNDVYENSYDYIIENNNNLDVLKESTKTFLGDIGLDI